MMSDPNLIKKQTLQEKIESEFLNKPSPEKTQPQSNQGPLKSLRTYQGDIEEALAHNNGSMTSVVLAEKKREKEAEQKIVEQEKKKEVAPEPKVEMEKPPSNPVLDSLPQQESTEKFVYNTQPQEAYSYDVKNRLFFSVGLTLLFIGALIVGTVYFFKSRDVAVNITQDKTIIGYSEKKVLNLASSTRNSFLSSIQQEKQNLKLPINSILYLDAGDADKFIELLAPHMPSGLSRALDKKYMLGIYSYDTNEPFIILAENDFGLSYAGMLEWEKNMVSDLGGVFSISEASTTVSFEDEALKNKDLRIIKDSNRKTVLLYTFIDKNTILITSNESIFSAILGKYFTSQISR